MTTGRSLGKVLHAALRPDEQPPTEEAYAGPPWPGIVGATGSACLVLGTIIVLVGPPASPALRDTFVASWFTAFLVAGSLLTIAWFAALRHGFGKVPVIIGSLAVACSFGLLLNQELPHLPDPWVKDYTDAASAAWDSIHRAMKLRVFLIVAPFVLFFAGLVTFKKLGWLRAIAALGFIAALLSTVTTVEDIKLSSKVDLLVSYTMFGSLIIAGVWVGVVFINLARSRPTAIGPRNTDGSERCLPTERHERKEVGKDDR